MNEEKCICVYIGETISSRYGAYALKSCVSIRAHRGAKAIGLILMSLIGVMLGVLVLPNPVKELADNVRGDRELAIGGIRAHFAKRESALRYA